MKKQIIAVSTVLVLAALSCKKNEPNPPQQEQGIEQTKPDNTVQQKMFDLSPEQTTAYIKTMKAKVLTPKNSTFKITQNTVTIAKDSALWALEAMLNFDYDNASGNIGTTTDTLSYNLAVSNNSVSYTDISASYNYIATIVNTHLANNTSDRVKLIDIQAIQVADVMTIKAEVVYTADASGFKTTVTCNPITVSAVWTSFTNKLGCTATYYAIDLCNTRLNCLLGGPGCPAGSPSYYYSNVITNTADNYDHTWSFYYEEPSVYCDVLSPSEMDSYISSAQSTAITLKPTSPSGMQTVLYTFKPKNGLIPGQLWSKSYWNLDVKYALVTCSPPPGE